MVRTMSAAGAGGRAASRGPPPPAPPIHPHEAPRGWPLAPAPDVGGLGGARAGALPLPEIPSHLSACCLSRSLRCSLVWAHRVGVNRSEFSFFYLARSAVLHLFLAVDNFSRLSSGAENPGYPSTLLILILAVRKMRC